MAGLREISYPGEKSGIAFSVMKDIHDRRKEWPVEDSASGPPFALQFFLKDGAGDPAVYPGAEAREKDEAIAPNLLHPDIRP